MELDAEELKFLQECGGPGAKYANMQFYLFNGNVSILYDTLHWHARHGTIEDSRLAKQLLMKVVWHPHENNIAIVEGWYLWTDYIEAATLPKYERFKSNEEAALHVKEAAAHGDVLAQKAIVEVARRRLNGYRKNDGFTSQRNS